MRGSTIRKQFALLLFLSCIFLTSSILVTAQEATPEVEQTPVEDVSPEATPTEEINTPEPTLEPTVEMTPEVTVEPTEIVTDQPTSEPTVEATAEPTQAPVLSAPPVFNVSASNFEATAGVPLDISLSVSDDVGVVRVAADSSASLGGVSVTTSDPTESAAPFNTGVIVTYLPPANYVGVDSFILSAIDSDGQSVGVVMSVNVAAVAAAEVTPEATAEAPEDVVQGAMTFMVNTTTDTADANTADGVCDTDLNTVGYQCSFRAALQQSNFNSEFTDTINFAIPGAAPAVISIYSNGIDITDTTIVQATLGKVVINDGNGRNMGLAVSGSGAAGTKISGLVITNFNYGVGVFQTSNVTISGNYIGVQADGIIPAGNSLTGITISESSNITIGGDSTAERNVISGNGIGLSIGLGSGNIISGNYVGTDKTGKIDVGNSNYGIYLANTTNNTIGGYTAAERNLISGNGSDGIYLYLSSTNQISGNYIGTDVTGKVGLGNDGMGVYLDSACTTNTIGGDSVGERNIIADNGVAGIQIKLSSSNTISGNYIGTDVTGTKALGNTQGIYLLDSQSSIIGGNTASERNIISANIGVGIWLTGSSSNTIRGNYIGTDVTGTKALGNAAGIALSGANSNTIGGGTAAERNLISANGEEGISLDNADSNQIRGNYIGTDVTGKKALGNGTRGIQIQVNADSNIIGGNASSEGNLISGNGGRGISIASSSNNSLGYNAIGTDVTGTKDLGNTGDGVALVQVSATSLSNNVIAFNNRGLVVSSGTGVSISGDRFFSNDGLGIDLGSDGVTANDAGDGDTGANNLQNFPIITEVTATGISGTINTTASAPIDIGIFTTTTCDASGYGEGIPLTNVSIPISDNGDGTGDGTFFIPFTSPLPTGTIFTAVAFNSSSDAGISEFSPCVVYSPTAPTAKPKHVYPASNGTVFTGSPRFEWGSAALADDYFLQVCADRLCSTVIDSVDTDTARDIEGSAFLDTALTDGSYYWRVRGGNGDGANIGPFSTPTKFTVNTLTGPTGNKPSQNSYTSDPTPTFSWGRLPGAVSYQLMVDNDPMCDGTIYQTTTTRTSFTVPSDDALVEGFYFWCVKAFDADGNSSALGGMKVFYIMLLKTPKNDAVMTDTTPTFTWYKAPGTGVTYTVEIDDSMMFDSPLTLLDASGITTTSYTIPAGSELAPDVYYWRLTVSGGTWGTPLQQLSYSFYLAPGTLRAPVLTSPALGATVDTTPTLTWEEAATAPATPDTVTLQYQILIDDNANFSSPIYAADTDTVFDDSFIEALENGKRYYWKVRAVYDNEIYGPFSSTRNFMTS
jgi:parallel beta-helix repeat protein